MADISWKFGALTLGVDVPGIAFPKTSISTDVLVPVTPAIAVGASLSMEGSPGNLAFELSAKAKLLGIFEVEYGLLTWNLFSPNSPLLNPSVPPIFLPPPVPQEIDQGTSWSLTFSEPGTIYYKTVSCPTGIVGSGEIVVTQGNPITISVSDPPVTCRIREDGSRELGGTLKLNGTPFGSGSFCPAGCDGSGSVGGAATGISTVFVPADRSKPIRVTSPIPKEPTMSCTCPEIDLLVSTKLLALREELLKILTCLAQDTRALRIGFFGEPTLSTATYGLTGIGVTSPLPGDVVELAITPTALPAGQEKWLTEPKLFSLGILIPVFSDGAYGTPLTLISPFGTPLRIPVSLAGIRRFYYFLYPEVSATLSVKWQVAPNKEYAEWCKY